MKDRNFPTDEQVAQIIDILFPIWEHFGNKKGLITHHGAYDSFGERHASSVYTIQFKKCTDVDTEITIRFWLSGIQLWESKNGFSKLITNTEQFTLYKFLLENDLLM